MKIINKNTKTSMGESMRPVAEVLDQASEWLGPGYKEASPGRYVSADGRRQFRMTDSDLDKVKNHAGAPHVNFEMMVENPDRPGRMMPGQNIHVFFSDE